MAKIAKITDYDKKLGVFLSKDFFDSLSFGMMPLQFINVLFYTLLLSTGLGWFVLGIVSALRHMSSISIDIFTGNYTDEAKIKRIRIFSIIYAFSFFIMIFGFIYESATIFASGMVLSGISVSSQGLLYRQLVKNQLRFGYKMRYYKNIKLFTLMSVILTFISALMFAKVQTLVVPLEISAISFLISSYLLFSLKLEKEVEEASQKASIFAEIRQNLSDFRFSWKALLFILSLVLMNAVAVFVYSYAGVFVFEHFRYFYLNGFANIALIFGFSIVLSMLLSKRINHLISRAYGQLPVIVFGSVLFSFMPFYFSIVPDFITLMLATAFGMIGMSLVRISAEVYMINNNLKSKWTNIFMIIALLIVSSLLFFVPNYIYLFYVLFFIAVFCALMFLLILLYEEKYEHSF